VSLTYRQVACPFVRLSQTVPSTHRCRPFPHKAPGCSWQPSTGPESAIVFAVEHPANLYMISYLFSDTLNVFSTDFNACIHQQIFFGLLERLTTACPGIIRRSPGVRPVPTTSRSSSPGYLVSPHSAHSYLDRMYDIGPIIVINVFLSIPVLFIIVRSDTLPDAYVYRTQTLAEALRAPSPLQTMPPSSELTPLPQGQNDG